MRGHARPAARLVTLVLFHEAALSSGIAQLLPNGKMIDLELVAMGRARAAHSAIPQPALDGLHDTVGLVVGIEVAEGHGQHMEGPM